MDRMTITQADELVTEVAELLPFPVELDADMAYGGLYIDLGRRGDVDDPHDTVSIDPQVEPTMWVLDIEGGRDTIVSSLGPAASAAEVSAWIVDHATRAGCPAVTPAP